MVRYVVAGRSLEWTLWGCSRPNPDDRPAVFTGPERTLVLCARLAEPAYPRHGVKCSMANIIIRSTEIVVAGMVISSVVAYACAIGHKIKAFFVMTIGYWCAAALVNPSVFYMVDFANFFVSLIAVAPLVWFPCVRVSNPWTYAASLLAMRANSMSMDVGSKAIWEIGGAALLQQIAEKKEFI